MNSFKKIALAMVAAMTLGTIVATPANAAVMTVAVDLAGTANTTASAIATPASLPVPADNTVDAADALKFVATVDTGTVVSVVTTNATIVSALHTTAAPVTSASGSSSLSIATGTGTTATFYVYTKTTAIGTVVINNGGTTLTYYVQGTAGKINNLTVTAPASGAAGTKQTITVSAVDVFGNKVSGAAVDNVTKTITATVFAATGTLDSATALLGSALSDFGVAEFKVTLPTTGSRTLITFAPTTAGQATTADVVGLPARTLAPFAEIAVRDLVSELAAQTAAKDAALAAKAISDAAVVKAASDAVAAKAASDAALATAVAAEKAASAKALADAKAASDAVVLAKDATIAKLTADNAAALKSVKAAFNKLALQWNKKNPKAKVTLLK
jgi:hypothetical protein